MQRQKISRIALVAGSLFLATYLSVYLGVLFFSDSYKTAVAFVNEHPEANRVLGKIESVRMGPLDFHISRRGPSGEASFELSVKGASDAGVVFLEMERSAGSWEVEKGRLQVNGQSVILR
jgi:hypothetical protein